MLPVLLYTGELPWGSARTIRDLLGGPAAFHPYAPDWGPIFWSLADRTPQQLLDGGAFMQVLAVMRVTREEQEVFERVFTEAVRRMQQLQGQDEVRWYELLNFALQYAVWRRPGTERQRLVELAAENNPGREREVRVMAQTIAEAYVNEGRAERRRKCAQSFVRFSKPVSAHCLKHFFNASRQPPIWLNWERQSAWRRSFRNWTIFMFEHPTE